jgi:hypothetical protein
LAGGDLSRRAELEAALRHMAPRVPDHEFGAIVDHAMDSAGLRAASAENAVWLSMTAYVRHVLTEYDELLAQGYDPDSARFFIVADIDAILAEWGVNKSVGRRPDQ